MVRRALRALGPAAGAIVAAGSTEAKGAPRWSAFRIHFVCCGTLCSAQALTRRAGRACTASGPTNRPLRFPKLFLPKAPRCRCRQ